MKKLINEKNKQFNLEKIYDFLFYLKFKADLISYENKFLFDIFFGLSANPIEKMKDENSSSYEKVSKILSLTREENMQIQMPCTQKTNQSKILYDKNSTPETNTNYGLSSFANIGNTCYLNSALQCLINTHSLKDFCLKEVPKISMKTSTMILEFSEIVKEIFINNKRSIYPYLLRSKLIEENRKVFFKKTKFKKYLV